MRQISLSLITTALIIAGCSKPPEPKLDEVQREEVFLEETITPVEAAPAAPVVAAPVAKKAKPATYRKAVVAPEEPMLIQEEQETIWVRDYRDSGEIQKTYNELQVSDDVDDFPVNEGAGGRTYNETQISD